MSLTGTGRVTRRRQRDASKLGHQSSLGAPTVTPSSGIASSRGRSKTPPRKRVRSNPNPQGHAQIFVKSTTTIALPFRPDHTVEDLRAAIQDKIGVPPQCQTITVGGKVLQDGRILADYNVQKDTTLFLSIRVTHTVPDPTKPLLLTKRIRANSTDLSPVKGGDQRIVGFFDGTLRVKIDVVDPYVLDRLLPRSGNIRTGPLYIKLYACFSDDEDLSLITTKNLELRGQSPFASLQCELAGLEPGTNYMLQTGGDLKKTGDRASQAIELRHQGWWFKTGPMTAFRQMTQSVQHDLDAQIQTRAKMTAKYSPEMDAAYASVEKYKQLYTDAKKQLKTKTNLVVQMTSKIEIEIAATEVKLLAIKNNGKKFRDEISRNGLEGLDHKKVYELLWMLGIDVKIAALCSHGIDGGALSGMSESDVATLLAVKQLGHRRRLSVQLKRLAVDEGFLPPTDQLPGVLSWDVGRVCRWLKDSSFEGYCGSFAAHSIDGLCLLDLSADDTKLLGVPMKKRAGFLSAIRKLKSDNGYEGIAELPRNCKICMEDVSSHIFTPCGHVCVCEGCAAAIGTQPPAQRKCPICRSGYQSIIKTYRN